jgi:hypothetical protein
MHTHDAFLDELEKISAYRVADGHNEEVFWEPSKDSNRKIRRQTATGAALGGTAFSAIGHAYGGKQFADLLRGEPSTVREYLKGLGMDDPRVEAPASGKINERKARQKLLDEKKNYLRLLPGGGEGTAPRKPDLKVFPGGSTPTPELMPKFKLRKFLKGYYGVGLALPAVLGALTVAGLANTEAVSREYKRDKNARHYLRRKK